MTKTIDDFMDAPAGFSRRSLLSGLAASFLVAPALALAEQKKASTGVSVHMNHALETRRTNKRQSTKYVILHTTEGGFAGSMSKIKRHANANYVLDTDGKLYQVVNPDHRSNHAGKSMWNGEEDLSRMSVGIEIVGYHYAPLSAAQYRTLGPLVSMLQSKYNLTDDNVLAHYQIAYASNKWTGHKKARGRKKDGINIDWPRIGVRHVTRDPDVDANRVNPDSLLAQLLKDENNGVLIGPSGALPGIPTPAPEPPRRADATPSNPMDRQKRIFGSYTIESGKSAWSIAGEDYNEASTFYVRPDKTIIAGNKIDEDDWGKLPSGTRVFTNTDEKTVRATLYPFMTLERGQSVWSVVQAAYNDNDTWYLPSGSNLTYSGTSGNIASRATAGTRIIMGANRPVSLGGNMTPFRAAGNKYRTDQAIYVMPNGELQLGNQIKDYTRLPRGTKVIVKK